MASGDFFQDVWPQVEKIGPKAVDEAKLLSQLYADKEVPWTVKFIIPIAAAASVYAMKHEGFIPNKIPFIGEVDNLTIAGVFMGIGVYVFKELAPDGAVSRAVEKIRREREHRDEIIGAAKGNKPQTQARIDSAWEVKK